ncbi:MAG: MaoC family dehydratase [Firmicutes bacterium]|jgi:3-hydroxybutyryl-CoA dehydratase|nr:MaoC family dehydratase [Bacillota bacterium]
MQVGEIASTSKIITVEDILNFSQIAGDANPVHTDPDFAKSSRFGEQIAQGMLIGSLISGVLGSKLPGPGCIYLEQTLKFIAPVLINDFITAFVEIIELYQKNQNSYVRLRTWCTNQNEQIVVNGEALMMIY